MRKVVFWVIGIIALIVVLTKTSDIIELLDTIQRGALIPIVLAVVFQSGRYVMQSAGMRASFKAVGETANLRRTITLVISGIFINTLAPSGGMASAVLLVDDGVKRGISPGKSTSAAMLGMMGNYTGFILIMFVEFIILGAGGNLDAATFICGMLMVLIVVFFSGMLFICRKSPRMLKIVFGKIEQFANSLFTRIHRKPLKPWADKFVDQFVDASAAIAERPTGLLEILGCCTLASCLEMLCFICVGVAFGVTEINVLAASYVVTYIFTVISPSPNGVGIAEAAAALVLTSFGTSVGTATAVALVFRGFVFWIPFAIGAVLLRRTGFFDEKKNVSDEEKARSNALVFSILVFVFAILNIFFTLIPTVPDQYLLLSEWFSIGGVFSPSLAVVLSVLLLLMTRGIAQRSRMAWAWTMALIVFLAAAQLIGAGNGGKYFVVLALLALGGSLYMRRGDFDRNILFTKKRRLAPIIIAAVIVVLYTLVGYAMLGPDYFGFTHMPLDALKATLFTLVPGLEPPHPVEQYGEWFYRSIFYVFGVTAAWACSALLIPRIRSRFYVRSGRAVLIDGEVHLIDDEPLLVAMETMGSRKREAASDLSGEPGTTGGFEDDGEPGAAGETKATGEYGTDAVEGNEAAGATGTSGEEAGDDLIRGAADGGPSDPGPDDLDSALDELADIHSRRASHLPSTGCPRASG